MAPPVCRLYHAVPLIACCQAEASGLHSQLAKYMEMVQLGTLSRCPLAGNTLSMNTLLKKGRSKKNPEQRLRGTKKTWGKGGGWQGGTPRIRFQAKSREKDERLSEETWGEHKNKQQGIIQSGPQGALLIRSLCCPCGNPSPPFFLYPPGGKKKGGGGWQASIDAD